MSAPAEPAEAAPVSERSEHGGGTMSKQEQKIVEGVGPMLEAGEQALAAVVAQPKGTTKGNVGRAALSSTAGSHMGGSERRAANEAAANAQLVLQAPCAVVLTNRRLLTVKISAPIGLGLGGKVKEIMSGVPVTEVEGVDVKKVALRQNITLRTRGQVIELEANAAASGEELAGALASLRGR
jgi:hypothetical protein